MKHATHYQVMLDDAIVFEGQSNILAILYYRHYSELVKRAGHVFYGHTVKLIVNGRVLISYCPH